MYTVEIYFVGGTMNKITNCSDKFVKNLVNWLENPKDNSTFKINFENIDRFSAYRKDLILFINSIEE